MIVVVGGGGGLSKNVDYHGWPIRKKKKKTLAKTSFSSLPKKRNLKQIICDSKAHIWNSFFENIFSDIQLFYVRSSGHRSFFLILDFLTESLKANKN